MHAVGIERCEADLGRLLRTQVEAAQAIVRILEGH
jgi:hypothetical protein